MKHLRQSLPAPVRQAELQPDSPPVWAPGVECPRCGARHQSWHRVASCRWQPNLWVSGGPPRDGTCYAVVSFCWHPGTVRAHITVTLWAERERAERAKRMIDVGACGGCCSRNHRLYVMGPRRA
jgi:hypothetical protein